VLLEAILSLLFGAVGLVLDLIPKVTFAALEATNFAPFFELLAKGFWLFPFELFMTFIANVLFWLSFQQIWGAAEFVWKKIPGIN
jgi:hypothetical protein